MTVELPSQLVTPDNPVSFGIGGWGYGSSSPITSGGIYDHRAEAAAYSKIHKYEKSVRDKTQAEFPVKQKAVEKSVNDQVAKIIADKTAASISTTEGIDDVKFELEKLIVETTKSRDAQNVLALAYDGKDPTPIPIRNHRGYDISDPSSYGKMVSVWVKSYQAVFDGKLYDHVLSLLQGHLSSVNSQQQAASEKTYRLTATASSVLTVPGRGVVPLGETALSLGQSIAQAIKELARIAAAGPGAYVATFIALSAYSTSTVDDKHDRTPDRIRYGLGVNADELGLHGGQDLQAIAAAQGTVELPWRLTNETRTDGRSYVSVVNTDGAKISKTVPVRAAVLNLKTGLYTAVLPSIVHDQPAVTLTWTPAAVPGGQTSTSTTPIVKPEAPVFTGVELKPISVKAQTYPGVFPDANDFIITFPADSGLKPVYVMFSEPLDSGIFTRKQLDKKYKHAKSFGVADTKKNSETLAEFRDAVQAHLKDSGTIEKGTYLYAEGSKVYFNSTTKNVVVLDSAGNFLSGWKLVPGTPQYDNYISTGKLK
ncbi:colicin/pyosin nuclease family protein [Pseudomonas putida]|nr:colicin/pyosin nuclease family protein [Pseudomonas putida]